MKYIDLFEHLKKIENYTDNEIEIDQNLVMRNFTFESNYRFILPGGLGNNDDYEFIPSEPQDYEPDVIQQMLNKKDSEIQENIKFRYHMIMPKKEVKSKGIIFLFHGFNEKTWYKYLPWAKYIVDKTGKSIVMFPIAFHMNRAPAVWSSTREMYRVSEQRKVRHPAVICSSLSNVAISTRLHNKPQRFLWSGLQTYYDVIDFVEHFKEGLHPAIDKDASIDFFSYSIGTFLGEILMMSNKDGFFTNSKYATFCGGAVFNRLSPVSKFILDSEANVSLYSYVVEHLESHMKRDEVLRHYMHTHPEGNNFRSMLNYKILTSSREETLRKMSHQFYAITLAKDEVVPPYEVVNTLQGSRRDIPINIEILDYPYKYIHEDPFPALTKIADEVDEQFRFTFDKISAFLQS
ncbi:hypothetical protein D0T84_04200 [Dysgonomonas sp. 521]|uniref:DUF6051 family protein n=1 Tax=Dysgonomonas sp. 521 TaxID=2302932 RepID=UPI0013D56205|nr:DUF6051 family protein [Dysgonomonas sp. 521]NDV94121.1 hypothetical protein [Dysgonomonas sp. 521]